MLSNTPQDYPEVQAWDYVMSEAEVDELLESE